MVWFYTSICNFNIVIVFLPPFLGRVRVGLYFTTNLTSSSSLTLSSFVATQPSSSQLGWRSLLQTLTFGISQTSLDLPSLNYELLPVLNVHALGKPVTLGLCSCAPKVLRRASSESLVTLSHTVAREIVNIISTIRIILWKSSYYINHRLVKIS